MKRRDRGRRRPPPDSAEVQEQRRNERLVRWSTGIIVVMAVCLAVLLALRWVWRG